MNRKEFLQMCAILGIGLPFASTLNSGNKNSQSSSNIKVTIIGAGAAGLCAGYLLKQQGIDFEILEASSTYGGRVKTNKSFVDFPIPLGAEWIHVKKGILTEIVNDTSIAIDVPTTSYNPKVDTAFHEGEEITLKDLGLKEDLKFIGNTWLTFFEDYILPSVADNLIYNQVVNHIDYSGEKIKIQSTSGEYISDKVVVTVPVKILQVGDIRFNPKLPKDKQKAINEVMVWDGFKVFIEFSEKFYPTFYSFDVTPETDGQKLYYDAAYGQNSKRHVLGLFTVGKPAEELGALTESELKNTILSELDELMDGLASQHFLQMTFQHWGKEPYTKAAYIAGHEKWRNINKLARNVDDKVYFAGDGYGYTWDWSSVHVAARSAKRAVEALV
jgi:monoamine oxidase